MKVVFLTYHNWETKRHGGFHKFAEEACLREYETVFFSFSRPYYSFFKKDERLNKNVLLTLKKGKRFQIGNSSLINITFPTLALPGPLRKFVPRSINNWLNTSSFIPFRKFARKYLENTDYFVFESNESILLFNKIKKLYPKSKFIYRPSDPLIVDNNFLAGKELELLREFDLTLLVNKQGEDAYIEHMPNFKESCTYSILANGVNLNAYKQKYTKPKELCIKNTALYIGAIDIDWDLIIHSAEQLPEVNFIIVCPAVAPDHFLLKVSQLDNLIFVNGIAPDEVPAWLTNCDIVIVPNPKNRFKIKPWGITAKYLQAMAAKKRIISYHDNPLLEKYGVKYVYDYNSFVEEVNNICFDELDEYNYKYNLTEREWKYIVTQFYLELSQL